MDLFLVIPDDALFNLLSRVDIPELQALWDNSPQRQFMRSQQFMTHYNEERQRRTRSAWLVIHRWNSNAWGDQWVHATRETDGFQINSRLPPLFFGNHRSLRYRRLFHLVGVVESNVIFFCENQRFCIWNLLTNRGRVIELPLNVDLGVYEAISGTRFTRTLGRLAFVHHVVYDVTLLVRVWLNDFAYNTQPQHQAIRILDQTEEFGTFDFVCRVGRMQGQIAFHLLGSSVFHLRTLQEAMRDLELEAPGPHTLRLSFTSNDGFLVIQEEEVIQGLFVGPTSLRLARMREMWRYEWVATENEPLLPDGTGIVSRSRLRVMEDSVVCYMFRWTIALLEEDENENEEDEVELGATEYIFYMFNLDTRMWLSPRRIQMQEEPGTY